MRKRFALFALILLWACEKDDPNPLDEVSVYVKRFYEELQKQNIPNNKLPVTVKFVDAKEIYPYAGYGSPDPPLVRLVKERWDTFTETQKEVLMYHELGHAVLNRVHTNELLPNCSSYKSIMNNTPANVQLNVYTSDDDPKRQYYINELFHPYIDAPSWGGTLGPNKVNLALDPSTFTYKTFGDATHTGDVADDDSLHVKGTVSKQGVGYWYLPIPSPNIPAGASLELTFKLKSLIQASGSGVFASLDVAQGSTLDYSTSTVYYGQIPNALDYVTYTIRLNCYPGSKPPMSVYLLLDGYSTGDVYFKDVQVSYYN